MLKFTYTETGIYLERLEQSVEELITLRVVLALRVGEQIFIEPGSAAFLLPADLPGLSRLKAALQQESAERMSVYACDREYVEVSLQGTWMSSQSDSAEGVFAVAMGERTELRLLKLWQESQTCSSYLRR